MNDFAFPVNVKTIEMKDKEWKIYYPALICLTNQNIMRRLNETTYQNMRQLVLEQFATQETNTFAQMIGQFEVKTNERSLISVTQSNYAIMPQAANGLTIMNSLTADTKTGEVFQLQDLFQKSSNYTEVLSAHVRHQLKVRGIPTLEESVTIKKNQPFYITDKCLVLYFQALEITPHYVGIPVFPISIFDLKDIMKDGGPLDRLVSS